MKRKRWALPLAVAAAVSCRPPITNRSASKPPPSTEEALTQGEILTPAGLPLPMTCTPTGPELCFDATDNNCNGVIDEGCGVETGPLQFAIAWPEGADVDLDVTDPRGQLAKPGERTDSGLAKDRDCGRPQNVCHGQNMENVFFAGERPQRGTYKVEIKLDKPDDVRFPVKVRFGGRVGVKTFSLDLELTSPEDSKIFALVVE